ncbi:MAG: ABC transporter ATP-binding protein, partial [Deltaproteobacteria bacterium]|nr:ABC transporter ATP-binding protein [Deltaproteobacteria bacterium]
DATVQAQILELVLEQVREHGLAVILVTHDMGVVARTADRVAVMYAGHVVERGPAEAVLGRPAHPYTRALLASTPRLDAPPGASPLPAIRGTPATGLDIPSGCPFHPRCDVARDECAASFPEPRDVPQPGAADEATAVAPDLPKHCVCCHVERGTP